MDIVARKFFILETISALSENLSFLSHNPELANEKKQ